jgi:beta-mannosidase
VLAKNVFITVKGESINLSDNFFDLLPGEERIVFLPPGKEIPDLEKKITLKTLTDTHL